MQAKYNSKMEEMILQRFEGNTINQLGTAKKIFKDFKAMYSENALEHMSVTKIRDKYQSLRRYGPNDGTTIRQRIIPVENKELTNTFQERQQAVQAAKILKTSKSSKTATLKDRILDMLIDSEDMTILIKGTEITVVFR